MTNCYKSKTTYFLIYVKEPILYKGSNLLAGFLAENKYSIWYSKDKFYSQSDKEFFRFFSKIDAQSALNNVKLNLPPHLKNKDNLIFGIKTCILEDENNFEEIDFNKRIITI